MQGIDGGEPSHPLRSNEAEEISCTSFVGAARSLIVEFGREELRHDLGGARLDGSEM